MNKALLVLITINILILFSCEKEEIKITKPLTIKTGVVTQSPSSIYTVFDTLNNKPSFDKYDITGDGIYDIAIKSIVVISSGGQDAGTFSIQSLGDVEFIDNQRIDSLITWNSNSWKYLENFKHSKSYPSNATLIIDTNLYVKQFSKNKAIKASSNFSSQKLLLYKYDYLHCQGYLYSYFLGRHWNKNNIYAIVRINTSNVKMIGWLRIKETYGSKIIIYDSFVYFYE